MVSFLRGCLRSLWISLNEVERECVRYYINHELQHPGEILDVVDLKEQEEAHVSMGRSDEEPHPDGDETKNYLGERLQVTPQQITAAHLTKLKQITESQIEGTVSDVVISVPPAWSNDQHLALLEAGQIEGLNVLKFPCPSPVYGLYELYKIDAKTNPRA
ncbi:unnamed protein product [Bursaphelenchus xylophilus]|uniref:(pine wood nematode) hypothetical protein n=1 Tax=Bursaphelenchus xylophilus TaxID=6326 RepID=A0A7I8XQG0_BURXY|nr:unnamed protein product [Bursaphelenchus xylophilus]CAG9087781.1 unnamed protein product [Bursaphelenchus xylophilus]